LEAFYWLRRRPRWLSGCQGREDLLLRALPWLVNADGHGAVDSNEWLVSELQEHLEQHWLHMLSHLDEGLHCFGSFVAIVQDIDVATELFEHLEGHLSVESSGLLEWVILRPHWQARTMHRCIWTSRVFFLSGWHIRKPRSNCRLRCSTGCFGCPSLTEKVPEGAKVFGANHRY
jgi:hypothetical protein